MEYVSNVAVRKCGEREAAALVARMIDVRGNNCTLRRNNQHRLIQNAEPSMQFESVIFRAAKCQLIRPLVRGSA